MNPIAKAKLKLYKFGEEDEEESDDSLVGLDNYLHTQRGKTVRKKPKTQEEI